MYVYTEFDQAMVDERVAQFRDQTQRFLNGTLSEDEYRPLRLQNGLYVQRYAPMLRIAVPYGTLNSTQVRKIASISNTYDRGYAHVSTRQNIQLNWPALEQVPDILAELASIQMHAIQTSGNCIRNTTTDQFAGRIRGEISDQRAKLFVNGRHSILNLHFCRVNSRLPSVHSVRLIVQPLHSMTSVFI
jgi:sulfite reductase (NADPH) hemoprotein beta-component